MARAIRLAEKALSFNEIPVGAIIIKNNIIIGQGYNQKELLNDPTAHAEIIAITSAASTEKVVTCCPEALHHRQGVTKPWV